MLKSILSISLTFFFVSTFAQSKILLDSFFYFNNDNLQISDKYQYDKQGRLIKRLYNTNWSSNNNMHRYTFQYFDVENIEIENVERWQDNEWEFVQKYVREFDANRNIVTEETQVWNKETNAFEVVSMIENIYNENNQIVSKIRKIGQSIIKRTWTYNEDKQLLLETFSKWNETDNEWETPITYRENRYDEAKNLIYQRYSAINSFTYEDSYTYDVNNRVLEFVRFISILGDTLNGNRTLYYYTNNELSKTTNQQKNSSINNWQEWSLPLNRTLFYYNDDGSIAEEISQDSIFSNWRNLNHVTFTYENGLISKSERTYWDINNNDWEANPFIINEYAYDELSELKYQLTETYNDDQLINDNEWFYYRSEKVPETLNSENIACLFPNPYVNYQTIYCETLEENQQYSFLIYNLLGQKIYQTTFVGKNGFRVEQQLEQGWYLFTILENGKVIGSQKVLVF